MAGMLRRVDRAPILEADASRPRGRRWWNGRRVDARPEASRPAEVEPVDRTDQLELF